VLQFSALHTWGQNWIVYANTFCFRIKHTKDSPVVRSPGWEPTRPRSNPIGVDRVLHRGLSLVETEQCVCVCLGGLGSELRSVGAFQTAGQPHLRSSVWSAWVLPRLCSSVWSAGVLIVQS